MGGVLSRDNSKKNQINNDASLQKSEEDISSNKKDECNLLTKTEESTSFIKKDECTSLTKTKEYNLLTKTRDPNGIFVYGLNPNWDRERLEKWLKYLGINFNVVTKKKRQLYGAIRFDNDDDRNLACKILEKEEPNDEELNILPLRKNITMSLSECQRIIARKNLKKKKVNIVDLITPLYNKMSYEEQLNWKNEKMKKDLDLDDAVLIGLNKNEKFDCKIKLSFGWDENEIISLGLYLGDRNGDVITPIDHCVNIPKSVIELSHKLKDFAIKSNYPIFDRALETGVWKFADITVTKEEQILLIIGIYGKLPNGLKEDVKLKFSNLVSSLFIVETFCKDGYGSTPVVYHLSGEEYLIHKIFNLNIIGTGISLFPSINNLYATELLLKKLNEIAIINLQTTLLDLYCGCGVLGISLSSKVHKLIGIDFYDQAINEANRNAKMNNIMNAEFINDRVEKALPNLLLNSEYKFTVIIDPPNNGINKQVLNKLRDCPNIQQIIFVCSKTENFLLEARNILTTPSYSSTFPFKINNTFGIDAFPYKEKIEYIISMIREK